MGESKKVLTLQNIVIGSKIDAPTNKMSETGYTFTGEWYADKDFKSKWDFANDVVTKDLTLYAYWTYDTIVISAAHTDSDGNIIADASNENFCNGKAVIEFAVQNGNPQNYEIGFDNEKLTTQTGKINGNRIEINLPKDLNPGTYNGYVELKATDGKTSGRLPIKMTIKLPYYSIVTLYNDVAAVNELAGSFTEFQWTKNGMVISGETSNTFQQNFDKSSVYTAILTFEDGSKYETCPLDLSKVNASKNTALKVYPNPAQPYNDVTVEVSENYMPDADKQMFIYNLNGTLVKKVANPEEVNKVQLPSGNYSGVYLQNGEKVSFKLIVK